MDVLIGGFTLIKQANSRQCWYASASMVCRYRGKPDPPAPSDDADDSSWPLSALDVLVRSFGFTAIDKEILKHPGFDAETFGRLLFRVACPLVCMGEYRPGAPGAGHMVMVYRVTNTTVYYADPFEPQLKAMDFPVFNRKLFKEMDPSCMMWLPK